jgi:hypothetical protein
VGAFDHKQESKKEKKLLVSKWMILSWPRSNDCFANLFCYTNQEAVVYIVGYTSFLSTTFIYKRRTRCRNIKIGCIEIRG